MTATPPTNPVVSGATSPRPNIQRLRASEIRALANAGTGRKDLLAFWYGEPDEVTPEFIRRAGVQALENGDTFYAPNLGVPDLRAALARYVSRLRRSTTIDQVAVTSSGMSALMIATQALIGARDRVVVVTPVWPNVVELPRIMGAEVVTVPLTFSMDGWDLDLDRLLDALTPATVALHINSPNNPTGWTMSTEARDAVLAHCRRHGVWLIADDVYERLYYGNESGLSPSFLDVAEPEERVIVANSFSKAWLMTGWRLGWLVTPRALLQTFANLIEYSTSCAPGFVQRAGLVALEEGEPIVARTRERFRRARDFLVEGLNGIAGVEAPVPSGAMYAFFPVPGAGRTFAFCEDLVKHEKLGLAPGSAFGPEGEGFVRWCFAADEERLAEGIQRLGRGVERLNRSTGA